MPAEWRYSKESQSLHVGAGRWDDIPVEAAQYTVGGTKILDSWLDYRMARPDKLYKSPLDEINATHWDQEWSNELTNLLGILVQLVNLEDEMLGLLDDILAGDLVSAQELQGDGVRWPLNDNDRKPIKSTEGTLFER